MERKCGRWKFLSLFSIIKIITFHGFLRKNYTIIIIIIIIILYDDYYNKNNNNIIIRLYDNDDDDDDNDFINMQCKVKIDRFWGENSKHLSLNLEWDKRYTPKSKKESVY